MGTGGGGVGVGVTASSVDTGLLLEPWFRYFWDTGFFPMLPILAPMLPILAWEMGLVAFRVLSNKVRARTVVFRIFIILIHRLINFFSYFFLKIYLGKEFIWKFLVKSQTGR
jgi:hypothetical protein